MNASALLMTLANRWFRGLAGWAVASSLIWLVLPVVPALRSPLRRAALIALVLLGVLVVNLVVTRRRRRNEKALTDAIGGTDADDGRAEVAALRERMRDAIRRLDRRGRVRLYEQPWYVLIGPPGAGKTTALLQSGLHFPLAREQDAPSVAGVGGTRLCDWWFAEEAVLIDTAGRYTTQDSDQAVDQAGWLGFLQLLRRTRPRQPLNGVVVVLSAVELATADRTERLSHARAVRRRIDEIVERLQLRVPVYLLLSKADRLRGFDAYFDDLDQSSRGQVWGTTFDLEEGIEAFSGAFRALVGRLAERLVERLQAERSPERRRLIGAFPLQVASLGAPLEEFLREAFTGSRLDPAPWLRGVYLTSATQEGTPIDRLTGLLARQFGIEEARAPALRPMAGRAYFLSSLLRDVLLGEALLVRDRPGRVRRRRALRLAGFSAIAACAGTALFLVWRADTDSQSMIERGNRTIASYRQLISALPLDNVSSDDLPALAAALDQAAGLSDGTAISAGWLGLSQGPKLAQADRIAYRRTLERILLPRLLWRLETQMRGHFGDPEFLYEATRVYLMLGGEGPLDQALVRAWMQADWSARYPGTLNDALRDRLLVHLGALLARPLPPVPVDGALVEAARATFSRVSVAERVYSRIRADATGGAVVAWSPASTLGPLGVRLFARSSGKSLTEGIPGLLTGEGYRNEFLTALPPTTRAVASESWVLGHDAEMPTDGLHLAALEEQVTALWVADTERHWDALLDDLALAPLGPRDRALRALYVLGSPESPVRDLLRAIVKQLTLDPDTGAAHSAHPSASSSISGLFGAGPAQAATPTPTASGEIAAHYGPLFALVAGQSGAPIDEILRLINALQAELAAASPDATSLPSALQGGGDPVSSLQAEADRQPAPVSRWLRQVALAGSASLGGAAREAAAAAFAGQDGPQALCRSVVDGHFPFDPGSATDASIDDFERLFAPGGALDGYFRAQVSPFVDTRGSSWHAHPLDGVDPPVDASSLADFQRAALIRDIFFPGGGGPAQVRFTLRPASDGRPATAGSASYVFSAGDASVGSDATNPVAFTWPVSSGASLATIHFEPLKGSDAVPISADGPWALFRLLAEGKLAPAGEPDTYTVSWRSGGARAVFELVAGSSRNPFDRNILAGFRCPTVR